MPFTFHTLICCPYEVRSPDFMTLSDRRSCAVTAWRGSWLTPTQPSTSLKTSTSAPKDWVSVSGLCSGGKGGLHWVALSSVFLWCKMMNFGSPMTQYDQFYIIGEPNFIKKYRALPSQGKMREGWTIIQQYYWVCINTKINADQWRTPLRAGLYITSVQYYVYYLVYTTTSLAFIMYNNVRL